MSSCKRIHTVAFMWRRIDIERRKKDEENGRMEKHTQAQSKMDGWKEGRTDAVEQYEI